jgi:hypothetical protein
VQFEQVGEEREEPDREVDVGIVPEPLVKLMADERDLARPQLREPPWVLYLVLFFLRAKFVGWFSQGGKGDARAKGFSFSWSMQKVILIILFHLLFQHVHIAAKVDQIQLQVHTLSW